MKSFRKENDEAKWKENNKYLKNEKIETFEQTRLSGVIITNNLKSHEKTKHIVKNANMKMLHKF